MLWHSSKNESILLSDGEKKFLLNNKPADQGSLVSDGYLETIYDG